MFAVLQRRLCAAHVQFVHAAGGMCLKLQRLLPERSLTAPAPWFQLCLLAVQVGCVQLRHVSSASRHFSSASASLCSNAERTCAPHLFSVRVCCVTQQTRCRAVDIMQININAHAATKVALAVAFSHKTRKTNTKYQK